MVPVPYNNAGFQGDASRVIQDWNEKAVKLYNDLMEAGVCREQARGILPQNLYTEFYGTVNLSNLLKFIDLRTHEGAQWEIQRVAEACLEIATDLWPEAVGAFRKNRNQ
jgi:thymidylate synthase (FAD)